MSTGQTALGISDIPFMYSLVSILYILIIGDADDSSRFYIIGLIAGTLGTFFVFWHPIQWLIDRNLISNRKFNSTYLIKLNGHDPPEYEVKVDQWLRLSLKTPAIKFLKDKIAGQLYFLTILIMLGFSFAYPPFLETIHLNNSYYSILIGIGLFSMIVGMCYLLIMQNIEFIKNVKIQSLYFLAYKNNLYGDPSILKSAIDLGDWITAREYANEILANNWSSLAKYSESNSNSISKQSMNSTLPKQSCLNLYLKLRKYFTK